MAMSYIEWEDAVTDELEALFGASRSDAQSIVEGNSFYMAQSWSKGMNPKETASLIFVQNQRLMRNGGAVKSSTDIAKQYVRLLNDYVKEKQFNKKVTLFQKAETFAKNNNVVIDSNDIIYVNGDKVAFIDKINQQTGQLRTTYDIKMFDKGGDVEDESVQMVKSQAKEARHHADELKGALKGQKHLDPWVVAKMERATTDLSDVTHYIDGRTEYKEGGRFDQTYTVFVYSDAGESEQIDNATLDDIRRMLDEGEDLIVLNSAGELIEPSILFGNSSTSDEMVDFDMDSYLKWAKIIINDFLIDNMDGRSMDEDWTFMYDNRPYFVEPFVHYKQVNKKKVKTVYFSVVDASEKEVGTIEYEDGMFTANSQFFNWNSEKFEEGGAVCKDGCKCEKCKHKRKYADGGVMNLGREQDMFVNDKIFRSHRDFILGGFTKMDYDNIIVQNNKTPMPFSKIEELAYQKLKRAVEEWRQDIDERVKLQGLDQYETSDDVASQQISNLTETYLNERFDKSNTLDILKWITSHTAYKNWLYMMEDRVADFNNQTFIPSVYQTSNKYVAYEDIKECVEESSLTSMFEQLSMMMDVK